MSCVTISIERIFSRKFTSHLKFSDFPRIVILQTLDDGSSFHVQDLNYYFTFVYNRLPLILVRKAWVYQMVIKIVGKSRFGLLKISFCCISSVCIKSDVTGRILFFNVLDSSSSSPVNGSSYRRYLCLILLILQPLPSVLEIF